MNIEGIKEESLQGKVDRMESTIEYMRGRAMYFECLLEAKRAGVTVDGWIEEELKWMKSELE